MATKTQTKKRNHFVSQFYLRRFAIVEPKEEIWTYDMLQGECRGTAVASTAFENHCYGMTLPDGTKSDDLENSISEIEGLAAPILDKVELGLPLTVGERAVFAGFMALTLVRTDAWRLQYATLAMNFMQLHDFIVASNDDAFNEDVRKFQEYRGPMTKEQITLLRDGMLNPQKFELSVDKEWTLRAMNSYETMAPIFFKMTWTVLTCDKLCYFIASDNPLVCSVPIERGREPSLYSGGGLLHKAIEVTFPLSRHSCLLATWDENMSPRSKVPTTTVKYLNRVRAIYATRFLFAPVRDSGLQALAAKYKDVQPTFRVSGAGPNTYSPVSLRRRRKHKITV